MMHNVHISQFASGMQGTVLLTGIVSTGIDVEVGTHSVEDPFDLIRVSTLHHLKKILFAWWIVGCVLRRSFFAGNTAVLVVVVVAHFVSFCRGDD